MSETESDDESAANADESVPDLVAAEGAHEIAGYLASNP
jgi:hypothetical protein